jgi:hypothetical protein
LGAAPVMSSPRKRIVPERSGRWPSRHSNSVDFPTPLRPSTASDSPAFSVKLTSWSTIPSP